MIEGGKALAGCLLFFLGKQRDKAAGKLQLAAWSLRRSGIEGALPFRAGGCDYLSIRLAGTPAGRIACEPEQGFFLKRRLCALSRIAVALKKPLRRPWFFSSFAQDGFELVAEGGVEFQFHVLLSNNGFVRMPKRALLMK